MNERLITFALPCPPLSRPALLSFPLSMVPGCSSIVWMMFTVIVLVSLASIDARAYDVCKSLQSCFSFSVTLVLLVLLSRSFMLGER